jgi:uncharacterized protein (TIGR03084 family)
MASEWSDLVDDLEAENRVVRAALEGMDDDAWDRPSAAEGWTLRDCVVHLAESDETATAAVMGQLPRPTGRREGVLTQGQMRGRTLTPDKVRAWYRDANARLVGALRGLEGDERLTWAGRAMSARSFTTARLMEHWSHGLDILEAAGVPAVDTDRLRHIALLGHLTRDFAYRTHGREPPATALYVELIAPSGAMWHFGPPDAPDRIYGSAGDFCRVVTQRIHPDDTSLRCEGTHAREFLSVAQAFAGPPGGGRPRRSESKA